MSSQPPVKITNVVDARDGYACIRCGMSLKAISGSRHHRQRRRDGGHTVPNLILLCGSGTTGCHGWVHDHPDKARACGYIVPATGRATPDDIPVLVRIFGVLQWVLLNDAGDRNVILGAVAQELLTAFGLIKVEAIA